MSSSKRNTAAPLGVLTKTTTIPGVEGALRRHPLSAAFWDPPESEFQAMTRDIAEHGLLEPIVTLTEGDEKLVLDGWGRYRGCFVAGVEPKFVDFADMKLGATTPTDFVMSRNFYRKHLSEVQRACIAVEINDGRWLKRGDTENQKQDGRVTLDEVAKTARVARSTLQVVRTIQRASPETFAKIKSGEVKNLKKVYDTNPKLRIAKSPNVNPSLAASRALSPMLIGAEKLAESLKLKPKDFAKQWAIWEGTDKAKRIKAMKAAHQWLGEVLPLL